MEKGDEEFKKLQFCNVGNIDDDECNEDDNDNYNGGKKQNNKDTKDKEKPGTLKQYRNI